MDGDRLAYGARWRRVTMKVVQGLFQLRTVASEVGSLANLRVIPFCETEAGTT